MLVQNNDFRTNMLIAAGAALLGALVFREMTGLAQPSVPPPSSQVPAVLAAPSATTTPAPTATAAPPSPTPLPTEAPATKTLAAILFQATVARATQSAIEYQATQVAIGVTQADEAARRNRADREDELAVLGIALTLITGVSMLVFVGVGIVLLARSREKEAEARADVERRRLLEVQAAVEAKREQKTVAATIAPPDSKSMPRNGHGEHGDTAMA